MTIKLKKKMDDNQTMAASAFIEEAYEQAFLALVDDSIGMAHIPDSSRTAVDPGFELHAPNFEFFDLLTWSVALSLLSSVFAVALQKVPLARSAVLTSEEIEQIKAELRVALSRNPQQMISATRDEADVRHDAIAYASRILVTHGWSEAQAQMVLESMLGEYEARLKSLRDSQKQTDSGDRRGSSRMMKILFLGANPTGTTHLALTREFQSIRRHIRSSDNGNQFQLEQEWAVKLNDLNAALLRHRPDIVHFSGHGSPSGELVLETESGVATTAKPEALTNLFKILKRNIRVVVLNACFSAPQAEAIAQHIDCVVGMSTAVGDEGAIAFAWAFYEALGFNASLKEAFELGCNQVDLSRLPDKDTPKLVPRSGIKPEEMYVLNPR